MPGRFQADAAGAEIEDHFFIHRAGGRAVRAFHVVGVNLQRRLAVHLRIVAEQQRFAGLLGIGLLRDLADEDFALEDAGGFAASTCLYSSWLGQFGWRVIEQRVVVAVLSPSRMTRPLSVASAPSPARTTFRSLRVSLPPRDAEWRDEIGCRGRVAPAWWRRDRRSALPAAACNVDAGSRCRRRFR